MRDQRVVVTLGLAALLLVGTALIAAAAVALGVPVLPIRPVLVLP